MAGVDLRTVAELMGHSSIQMTMRYAHLTPQHNRAAVDRLVPVSEPPRTAKNDVRAAKRRNRVVTKSATNKKTVLRKVAENRSKPFYYSALQQVAP